MGRGVVLLLTPQKEGLASEGGKERWEVQRPFVFVPAGVVGSGGGPAQCDRLF